ncbi:DMT family transporter [Parabacteroides sp. OttesenSCG-928-K15]|nr:DMT family transporter [Parabacteroides sp. OttesenSCG-928-K15]
MKSRAILACILWGSAFAGAKIGFQYADPIYLSGMRFTLAGLLLVPVILIKKIDIKAAMKHWRFMLLFAFVQTFLQYGLFFMGLNKVPGAISSIIIGAGPLFVAIMAHITLKNDKMTLRKMLAIALGIAGIVFISITQGKLSADNPSFYAGVGLLVLSNIIGSYTNIMVVKKKSYNISPYVLTSFANFTGGIMLLITAFIVEKPEIKLYPPEFYGALLWLAFIPAASFSLWYGLLQRPEVKVSELNMWKFIIPVTGCVLSWLLLPDESPTVHSVTGILIITFALQLQQLPERFFKRLKRK